MWSSFRLVRAAGSSCTISFNEKMNLFSFSSFSWTVRVKKGDRIDVGDVDKSDMVEKDLQVLVIEGILA
jgi:hypothetical protein